MKSLFFDLCLSRSSLNRYTKAMLRNSLNRSFLKKSKPSSVKRLPLSHFLIVTIASGLSGCISMIPDLPKADSQTPSQYPTSTASISTASNSSATNSIVANMTIQWQDYFVDPVLVGYIKQALQNNRDLRIAILKVDEARAAYGIQKSASLPTLAAGLTNARASLPRSLALPGQPSVTNINFVNLGFSSWEIDFWGRVRSLKTAALDNYLSADAARHAATLSLISEVANQYLVVRELEERLVIAKRTTENRKQALDIYQKRVQMGASSKLELTQLEILLQQSVGAVAQLEQLKAMHSNAFAVLVGAPAEFKGLPEHTTQKLIAKELEPGLPSSLLVQRPDIVAAEYSLKAANANIGAARAAFFPQISLTALGGYSSSELSNLFLPGNQLWIFSPSISLPIFTAGRLKSNLDLAENRSNQALANYEKTIQNAFRDVSDALAAKKWLEEQVQSMSNASQAAHERTRLMKLRYENGASRYSEYLEAQKDDFMLEQQLIQLRRARNTADVALFASLGGGILSTKSSANPSTKLLNNPSR